MAKSFEELHEQADQLSVTVRLRFTVRGKPGQIVKAFRGYVHDRANEWDNLIAEAWSTDGRRVAQAAADPNFQAPMVNVIVTETVGNALDRFERGEFESVTIHETKNVRRAGE